MVSHDLVVIPDTNIAGLLFVEGEIEVLSCFSSWIAIVSVNIHVQILCCANQATFLSFPERFLQTFRIDWTGLLGNHCCNVVENRMISDLAF